MKRIKLIIAALLVLSPFAANADLIIEVIRLSDSEAIITGSGDVEFGASDLALSGSHSTGNPGTADLWAGDFAVGGNGVGFAFARVGQDYFLIGIIGGFSPGDLLTGSLTVTLDVETWSAIGTTGDIFSETFGPEIILGSYSIVGAAVPEPGTLALLGIGLLGMGLARRKV